MAKHSEPLFRAEQFVPTRFDGAADKARFANHFVRFVKGGFKRTLFPRWFYVQVSNTFGHIAHYDQAGFYEAQFSDAEARLAFVQQAARWPCYGSADHTFSDVERALAAWLKSSGVIADLRAEADRAA